MGAFYEAVKAALAPAHAQRSDRWVTASKLCARKRPHLFPVRDTKVTELLDTRRFNSYLLDWQVYYAIPHDRANRELIRREPRRRAEALTSSAGCP